MTKIIDLPTTASTDSNTFVPVYKNGKTQKVSATALGGGGSGLDLTSTTDVPAVEGTEYIPLNKPLGTVLRVTVQRILDWILARANTWTGVQTFNSDINFPGTGRRITGDFSNATLANRLTFQTSTANGATALQVVPNGTGTQTQYTMYTDSAVTNGPFGDLTLNTARFQFRTGVVGGTGTAVPMTFDVNGSERLRIDTTGNVLATSGTLGYGIGSGGTVVQATSKSTTVTLNKPSGQITMHNASLAAGATARFVLYNTYIAAIDEVAVWLSDPIGNALSHIVWVDGVVDGVCAICVKNINTIPLPLPIKIGFAVRKGSTS